MFFFLAERREPSGEWMPRTHRRACALPLLKTTSGGSITVTNKHTLFQHLKFQT